MRMFNTRHDDLYRFLSWRRKTRFLRRHGGPLLALLVFIATLHLIWQAHRQRSQKDNSSSMESSQAWQAKPPARR